MIPSTRSSEVAIQVAMAPCALVASTLKSTGRLSTGGVVSCTVTVKLPVAGLPAPSVALQSTVVGFALAGGAARAKVLPEAGTHVTGTSPLTMSCAVALKVATAPAAPVASFVMSSGSVRCGGVVSTTSIVKLLVDELPAASCALHCTVLVPSAKVAPDAGRQFAVPLPSTASIQLGLE